MKDIVLILMMFLGGMIAAQAQSEQNIDELKQEVERLKQEMKGMSAEMDKALEQLQLQGDGDNIIINGDTLIIGPMGEMFAFPEGLNLGEMFEKMPELLQDGGSIFGDGEGMGSMLEWFEKMEEGRGENQEAQPRGDTPSDKKDKQKKQGSKKQKTYSI